MYLESIASRYPRALPQGCPGSPTLHVLVHLRERLLMGAALAVLLRECRGVMSTSFSGERVCSDLTVVRLSTPARACPSSTRAVRPTATPSGDAAAATTCVRADAGYACALLHRVLAGSRYDLLDAYAYDRRRMRIDASPGMRRTFASWPDALRGLSLVGVWLCAGWVHGVGSMSTRFAQGQPRAWRIRPSSNSIQQQQARWLKEKDAREAARSLGGSAGSPVRHLHSKHAQARAQSRRRVVCLASGGGEPVLFTSSMLSSVSGAFREDMSACLCLSVSRSSRISHRISSSLRA